MLVVADPLAVADPAFVLTFGATLGILVVVPAVRVRPQRSTQNSQKSQRYVFSAGSAGSALYVVFVGMLAASVAAEALLFPVGALLFSRVTFAGLALNFLAIPLMAVAQVAGMAVVPLALISERLATLGRMAGSCSAPEGWCGRPISSGSRPQSPGASPPPAWGVVVLYYAALVVCWALWRRRSEVTGSAEPPSALPASGDPRWRSPLVAAIWILAQPLALLAGRGDGRLHVTFLDVGQGDSALVRFPRGTTMLVDAGGLTGSSSFDIGDRVVAPVLRDQRHSTSRLHRADARRSGPHRRGAGDRARFPSTRGVGGHSRPSFWTAHGAAGSGAGVRGALGQRLSGRPSARRRRGRSRRGIRRRPTGSGRRCGTTTRLCSTCVGGTCRCF